MTEPQVFIPLEEVGGGDDDDAVVGVVAEVNPRPLYTRTVVSDIRTGYPYTLLRDAAGGTKPEDGPRYVRWHTKVPSSETTAATEASREPLDIRVVVPAAKSGSLWFAASRASTDKDARIASTCNIVLSRIDMLASAMRGVDWPLPKPVDGLRQQWKDMRIVAQPIAPIEAAFWQHSVGQPSFWNGNDDVVYDHLRLAQVWTASDYQQNLPLLMSKARSRLTDGEYKGLQDLLKPSFFSEQRPIQPKEPFGSDNRTIAIGQDDRGNVESLRRTRAEYEGLLQKLAGLAVEYGAYYEKGSRDPILERLRQLQLQSKALASQNLRYMRVCVTTHGGLNRSVHVGRSDLPSALGGDWTIPESLTQGQRPLAEYGLYQSPQEGSPSYTWKCCLQEGIEHPGCWMGPPSQTNPHPVPCAVFDRRAMSSEVMASVRADVTSTDEEKLATIRAIWLESGTKGDRFDPALNATDYYDAIEHKIDELKLLLADKVARAWHAVADARDDVTELPWKKISAKTERRLRQILALEREHNVGFNPDADPLPTTPIGWRKFIEEDVFDLTAHRATHGLTRRAPDVYDRAPEPLEYVPKSYVVPAPVPRPAPTISIVSTPPVRIIPRSEPARVIPTPVPVVVVPTPAPTVVVTPSQPQPDKWRPTGLTVRVLPTKKFAEFNVENVTAIKAAFEELVFKYKTAAEFYAGDRDRFDELFGDMAEIDVKYIDGFTALVAAAADFEKPQQWIKEFGAIAKNEILAAPGRIPDLSADVLRRIDLVIQHRTRVLELYQAYTDMAEKFNNMLLVYNTRAYQNRGELFQTLVVEQKALAVAGQVFGVAMQAALGAQALVPKEMIEQLMRDINAAKTAEQRKRDDADRRAREIAEAEQRRIADEKKRAAEAAAAAAAKRRAAVVVVPPPSVATTAAKPRVRYPDASPEVNALDAVYNILFAFATRKADARFDVLFPDVAGGEIRVAVDMSTYVGVGSVPIDMDNPTVLPTDDTFMKNEALGDLERVVLPATGTTALGLFRYLINDAQSPLSSTVPVAGPFSEAWRRLKTFGENMGVLVPKYGLFDVPSCASTWVFNPEVAAPGAVLETIDDKTDTVALVLPRTKVVTAKVFTSTGIRSQEFRLACYRWALFARYMRDVVTLNVINDAPAYPPLQYAIEAGRAAIVEAEREAAKTAIVRLTSTVDDALKDIREFSVSTGQDAQSIKASLLKFLRALATLYKMVTDANAGALRNNDYVGRVKRYMDKYLLPFDSFLIGRRGTVPSVVNDVTFVNINEKNKQGFIIPPTERGVFNGQSVPLALLSTMDGQRVVYQPMVKLYRRLADVAGMYVSMITTDEGKQQVAIVINDHLDSMQRMEIETGDMKSVLGKMWGRDVIVAQKLEDAKPALESSRAAFVFSAGSPIVKTIRYLVFKLRQVVDMGIKANATMWEEVVQQTLTILMLVTSTPDMLQQWQRDALNPVLRRLRVFDANSGGWYPNVTYKLSTNTAADETEGDGKYFARGVPEALLVTDHLLNALAILYVTTSADIISNKDVAPAIHRAIEEDTIRLSPVATVHEWTTTAPFIQQGKPARQSRFPVPRIIADNLPKDKTLPADASAYARVITMLQGGPDEGLVRRGAKAVLKGGQRVVQFFWGGVGGGGEQEEEAGRVTFTLSPAADRQLAEWQTKLFATSQQGAYPFISESTKEARAIRVDIASAFRGVSAFLQSIPAPGSDQVTRFAPLLGFADAGADYWYDDVRYKIDGPVGGGDRVFEMIDEETTKRALRGWCLGAQLVRWLSQVSAVKQESIETDRVYFFAADIQPPYRKRGGGTLMFLINTYCTKAEYEQLKGTPAPDTYTTSSPPSSPPPPANVNRPPPTQPKQPVVKTEVKTETVLEREEDYYKEGLPRELYEELARLDQEDPSNDALHRMYEIRKRSNGLYLNDNNYIAYQLPGRLWGVGLGKEPLPRLSRRNNGVSPAGVEQWLNDPRKYALVLNNNNDMVNPDKWREVQAYIAQIYQPWSPFLTRLNGKQLTDISGVAKSCGFGEGPNVPNWGSDQAPARGEILAALTKTDKGTYVELPESRLALMRLMAAWLRLVLIRVDSFHSTEEFNTFKAGISALIRTEFEKCALRGGEMSIRWALSEYDVTAIRSANRLPVNSSIAGDGVIDTALATTWSHLRELLTSNHPVLSKYTAVGTAMKNLDLVSMTTGDLVDHITTQASDAPGTLSLSAATPKQKLEYVQQLQALASVAAGIVSPSTNTTGAITTAQQMEKLMQSSWRDPGTTTAEDDILAWPTDIDAPFTEGDEEKAP